MRRTFLTAFFSKRSEESIALLIEGETMAAQQAIAVLAEVGRWGMVRPRRVYGDWSSPHMQSWQPIVTHYGMRAVHHHASGRHAADLSLAIDAMELFHQGYRRFCLVSGQRDPRPLVLWLVEHGCQVIVIGHPNTSEAVQRACSVFVSTDQLSLSLLTTTPAVSPPPSIPRTVTAPEETPKASHALSVPGVVSRTALQALLVNAYAQVVAQRGDLWATTTDLGAALQRLDPTFKAKAYGSPTLRTLLEKQDPLFEVRETGGGQAVIRLRAGGSEADDRERGTELATAR